MIIYLIRHGKSRANEAQLVTGTPLDSLSEKGLTQVSHMEHWLRDAGIIADRYVTSQWGRAQQTAFHLWPQVDWSIDTRIGETNGGDVAEWTLSDFKKCSPNFYANPANCYPGGESHLDLNNRVLDWLDEQLQKPCGRLALVAHSGPITCILQHVLGISMERFPVFLPAQASLSAIKMIQKNSVWSGRLLIFSVGAMENLSSTLYEGEGES